MSDRRSEQRVGWFVGNGLCVCRFRCGGNTAAHVTVACSSCPVSRTVKLMEKAGKTYQF